MLFESNEKELKKETNIPEEDDLRIIAGYKNHTAEEAKFFITEDEHFWAYSELIYDNFSIRVIKEWECNKLTNF